jgi:hypothetical protein
MGDESHFIEQVVRIDDLHNKTSVGWEVVEKIEFDEPISYQDHHVQPGNSYPIPFTRTQIGRSVGFRVRLTVNSPVATLTERARALESEKYAAEQAKGSAEEVLDVERAKHQKTQAELKLAHEYSERSRKDRDQIEAIKRQLEADLGKIREHIGRKAFEEILPPVTPR